ncbi:uncharacterized protein LOC134138678 [Rhea pennata]|uniref:uncharacterized protein LOC134138678 n=1 Tax=Rhea pennata TaxID=8795 RepID=UPI002E255653
MQRGTKAVGHPASCGRTLYPCAEWRMRELAELREEDSARDVLVAEHRRGRETPPVPRLPPLPSQAARQAQGGLEASVAKRAAPPRGSQLPALEAACRSSARHRANGRERLPPLSGAGKALDSGWRLRREELKPSHLALPALRVAKREAGALPRPSRERVHCTPEAKLRSCTGGKARLVPDSGATQWSILPGQSRQLPGHSCFAPAAQTMPQRQVQGMAGHKERDEPWPSCLTVPRLPQLPLGVALNRTAQEQCQDLKSKVRAAPKETCAQEGKVQRQDTMVHGQVQDGVLGKSGVSQGADLLPAEEQVPRAENAPGEAASSAPEDALQQETRAKGASEGLQLTSPCFAAEPRSSAKAMVGKCHSEIVPPEETSPCQPESAGLAPSVHRDGSVEMRAEHQRAAPHSPATPATAPEDTGLGLVRAAERSPGQRRQLGQPHANNGTLELSAGAVQEMLAHATAAAALASALQVQSREDSKSPEAAALQQPDHHAHSGTRKASRAGAPASPGRGCAPPSAKAPSPAQGTIQKPLGIMCRFRGRTLRVHPDNTSRYLAVLSIKTEPLEELERSCLARTGQTLAQLREACLQRKEQRPRESESKEEEGKGKRFSLTPSGRLNVRPRELCARNSFYNLWRPELTRVELLKDASSKWQVLERLYAHAPEKERERGGSRRTGGAPQREPPEWSDEEGEVEEEALQGEELQQSISLCMTWVRPSLRSLLEDGPRCQEEVPRSPSIEPQHAATEAAGELQSTPPAPAAPRGAEAAAPPLAGGIQHAEDGMPLAPSASAGARAEACPTHADPQPCPVPARPLAQDSPSPARIADLPHAAPPRRWSSRLRAALGALRRAFCCCCLAAQ